MSIETQSGNLELFWTKIELGARQKAAFMLHPAVN